MTYLVCQTPKCQQTYPIEKFTPESKNIPCEKCGGVLIDDNGRANMSQHSWVRPVITPEEIEQQRKEELSRKYEELSQIQTEINTLEKEDRSCYDCKFYNGEHSICDVNYRARAILDERESARDCDYFEKGSFIDSDEHLLVDK